MIKAALLVAAASYLIVGLAVYFLQRQLIYHPDPAPRADPKSAGLTNVAEITIPAPEGAEILAWYGKAQAGQPTILYFHGNAGSLASRSERIKKYMARGRGVFMMSYRGYSGSGASPSEAANIADAKRAYDRLRSDGVKPDDIIIYGESLGSGVAVQVAADKAAAGLILDAPYSSFAEVGQLHYPWLPVKWLMRERYDSISYIPRVHVPVLFIHGERDTVVPVALGRALFAAANDPKSMVTFPDAGHADHYMFGSYETINAWIDKLRGKAPE